LVGTATGITTGVEVDSNAGVGAGADVAGGGKVALGKGLPGVFVVDVASCGADAPATDRVGIGTASESLLGTAPPSCAHTEEANKPKTAMNTMGYIAFSLIVFNLSNYKTPGILY